MNYHRNEVEKSSTGHRKFFLSPQSANPQPNFNFLIRNRKSAIGCLKA